MGTNDDDLIMEAIGILRKSGSIDYGFAKSKQMLNDAWSGLAPVLPEGKTKDQLRQLSEYLVNRDLWFDSSLSIIYFSSTFYLC